MIGDSLGINAAQTLNRETQESTPRDMPARPGPAGIRAELRAHTQHWCRRAHTHSPKQANTTKLDTNACTDKQTNRRTENRRTKRKRRAKRTQHARYTGTDGQTRHQICIVYTQCLTRVTFPLRMDALHN